MKGLNVPLTFEGQRQHLSCTLHNVKHSNARSFEGNFEDEDEAMAIV